MTLTPQDRETIEREHQTFEFMPPNSIYEGSIGRLLAILDRLAEEDDADNDLPEYLDHTDDPVDMGPGMLPRKPAAPSSPLPDALCARCGKRYDEHYLNAKFCTDHNGNWDIFLPAPDKPVQDEAERKASDLQYLMATISAPGDERTQHRRLGEMLIGEIAASEARINDNLDALWEKINGMDND
jgi:hypothetical protein